MIRPDTDVFQAGFGLEASANRADEIPWATYGCDSCKKHTVLLVVLGAWSKGGRCGGNLCPKCYDKFRLEALELLKPLADLPLAGEESIGIRAVAKARTRFKEATNPMTPAKGPPKCDVDVCKNDGTIAIASGRIMVCGQHKDDWQGKIQGDL